MANVTMKKIAQELGVSLATVSRAIHSPDLVHFKTRERILSLMKTVGYVYNASAADLRKKSKVIGVIIPSNKIVTFGITMNSIQEHAYQNGFSTIIGNTHYRTEIENKLLIQFEERRLAGIILTGFSTGQKELIKDIVKRGMPCVVIWEKLDDELLSYVGFDNFRAAFIMTEYLIRLKHKRIGLIIGPFSKIGRVKERLNGYSAALEKHHIPFDPLLVIEKEPSLIEGKEAMNRLLAINDMPTAVFAASDVLAIGAMAAIREKGLKVPEDISIAGFDDIDFAAFCDPPLTSIRVPADEIGRLSAKVLMDMIENDHTQPRQYCLDLDLIIRSSCREYVKR